MQLTCDSSPLTKPEEDKGDWYGQMSRVTRKMWMIYVWLNIKLQPQSFAEHCLKEADSCNQKTEKQNQTQVSLFLQRFGVSDFFKKTLKLSFTHSNFLYNFYEQTKSLGHSVFAHSWSFGGTLCAKRLGGLAVTTLPGAWRSSNLAMPRVNVTR